MDTGTLTDVDNVVLFGPEAAFAWSSWSISGEYNAVRMDRVAERAIDFRSWYVAATRALGGGSRAAAYRIDAGEFRRLV